MKKRAYKVYALEYFLNLNKNYVKTLSKLGVEIVLVAFIVTVGVLQSCKPTGDCCTPTAVPWDKDLRVPFLPDGAAFICFPDGNVSLQDTLYYGNWDDRPWACTDQQLVAAHNLGKRILLTAAAIPGFGVTNAMLERYDFTAYDFVGIKYFLEKLGEYAILDIEKSQWEITQTGDGGIVAESHVKAHTFQLYLIKKKGKLVTKNFTPVYEQVFDWSIIFQASTYGGKPVVWAFWPIFLEGSGTTPPPAPDKIPCPPGQDCSGYRRASWRSPFFSEPLEV